MPVIINLDYETQSECNLPDAGAYAYSLHPSTRVLMAAWSIQGDTRVYSAARDGVLPVMKGLLTRPDVEIRAANAEFEYLMTKNVLGLNVPIERYRCTLVKSYAHAFKGSLAEVMRQAGFPSQVCKRPEGQGLIKYFSVPSGPGFKDPWHPDHAAKMAQFLDYNQQDVVAERALDQWLDTLEPMEPWEWEDWIRDHHLNTRGVPVDMGYCDSASNLFAKAREQMIVRLNRITGGNGNKLSLKKFKEWLARHGFPVPNLQAETVKRLLAENHPASRYLEMFALANGKAATKYKAMLQRERNGRLHGMFQFYGASRTGREASRVINLQNLKRGNLDDTTVRLIQERKLDLLALIDEPLELLSRGVRSAIYSEKGLSVSDLSSIESRILGWLADCEAINRIFAEGLETYKDFAAEYYQIPYDEVTKEQRVFSKPPVLGCGYRLGGPGLQAYAKGMGVDMTREVAKEMVAIYRKKYPEIPALWDAIFESVEAVVTGSAKEAHHPHGIRIFRSNSFLYIQLPSRRKLAYFKPVWEVVKVPYTDEDGEEKFFYAGTLTYLGINSYTTKWERVQSHSGKMVENIVQAIAADILRGWGARMPFVPLIASAHDEWVAEGFGYLEEMNAAARIPFDWAPGLLLDAQGYESHRYRKD